VTFEMPTLATPGTEPTKRELAVLRLVGVKGLGTRETADELGISPSTVRKHLENVRRRTGSGHIAQAVWALRELLAG
jgi:DNA-binding CsgD family transcriptional regulator